MASSTALSSGPIATGVTTVLATGRGLLNSINVTTDGTNAATVTVYDNTAASGKVIAVLAVPGASLSGWANFARPIRTDIGLTVLVAGTGATGYVNHGAA